MSTLVIGVGNPDRGDDGVGWRVAELLAGRIPTLRSSGDPASLIEAWSSRDRVVVVDATSTGSPPGTVTVGTPTAPPGSTGSSHGLGLSDAIELGRALASMPAHFTVIGIEGGRFDHGAPLSDAVEAAAVSVAADILDRTASPEPF